MSEAPICSETVHWIGTSHSAGSGLRGLIDEAPRLPRWGYTADRARNCLAARLGRSGRAAARAYNSDISAAVMAETPAAAAAGVVVLTEAGLNPGVDYLSSDRLVAKAGAVLGDGAATAEFTSYAYDDVTVRWPGVEPRWISDSGVWPEIKPSSVDDEPTLRAVPVLKKRGSALVTLSSSDDQSVTGTHANRGEPNRSGVGGRAHGV